MYSPKGENWRKDNTTVCSRLKFILNQHKFTDVTVVVQGKEFKCHRLILALGSPYFERTFYHTFKDDRSSPILISDVRPEAFQCVQTFLYTDKVTFGNEKQAFQTFEAADKFDMYDLKSECEIYLSELDFRPCNIWNSFNQAILLRMEKLRKKCLTYVQNNAGECLRNQAFKSASEDAVLDVVKSGRLAISESELLDLLVDWAVFNKRLNNNLLRVYLLPYLTHIRFRAMRAVEFCKTIKIHPSIISPEHSLAILQYLELPNKNTLPSWCSTLPKRIWP